jgi:protein-disulfide isomerase
MTRTCAILILTAGAVLAQSAGSSKIRGISVAAITIEVFSDFQCPACKNLHETTIRPLITEYVDKGRVFLINREFPLPMHQYARPAAAWATAAAKMGKYTPVADALFAHQDAWSKDGHVEAAVTAVLSPEEAQKAAKLAKTPEIAAEVENDIQKGRAANVRQTPTMIITHRGKTYPVAGSVSFPILRRFLDDLLTR